MQNSNLSQHWEGMPENIKKIFKCFNMTYFENPFVQSLHYLIQDIHLEFFNNNKWILNPMQFCQDYYKQQYYYPIIHLVNNIGSIYEFTPDYLKYIKVPNENKIISILQHNLTNFDHNKSRFTLLTDKLY